MPDAIEADLNRMIVAVEKYVAQKLDGASAAVVTVPDADRLEAMRMGRSAGLVDELQRDLAKLGIIGEEGNRLLLYLGLTSRKMDDPLAIQILSSSGAGKSHLQDAVLSLCPGEDLIKLTSLSGQALFYKGEDSLRHKCLAIAEVAGAEGARYALRNLISEKKLVIESTIKNALSGRLETQLNIVHGPTAVFETTINPDTDPETKSRYVLLSVDESPEQTRAIVEAQRQSHTLDGRKRGKVRAALDREASRLPATAPTRRGRESVRAAALVRRRSPGVPPRSSQIPQPDFGGDLPASDAAAEESTTRSWATTSKPRSTISRSRMSWRINSSANRSTIFPSPAVKPWSGSASTSSVELSNSKTAGEEIIFSRRELRETFGWSDTRLRVYLRELVALEYLAPVTGRKGLRFCYRLDRWRRDARRAPDRGLEGRGNSRS